MAQTREASSEAPILPRLLYLVEEELQRRPLMLVFSEMLRYQARTNINEITAAIIQAQTDQASSEHCADLFYCLGRALHANSQSDLSEAYGAFYMAIELTNHIGAHLFAACVKSERDQWSEAAEHLQAVLNKRFSRGIVGYHLALAYFKADKVSLLPMAVAALKESIAADPKNAKAFFFLAYAQLFTDEHAEAVENFLQAVRLDPRWAISVSSYIVRSKHTNNAFSAFFLGVALSYLPGQQDTAIANFAKVLASKDKPTTHPRLLAEVEIRQEIAASLLSYEYAVPPEEFYVVLGQRFLQKGFYQDAEMSFAYALRYQPKNIRALLGQATLCVRAGDLESAFDAVSEALTYDPQCIPAIILLGEVYCAQNKTMEACDMFKRAIGLPGASLSDKLYCHTWRVKLCRATKLFNGMTAAVLEKEESLLRHALRKMSGYFSVEGSALQLLGHSVLGEVAEINEQLRGLFGCYRVTDIPERLRYHIFELLLQPRFWPADTETYVMHPDFKQFCADWAMLLRKPSYPESRYCAGIRFNLSLQMLCSLTSAGRLLCDERVEREKRLQVTDGLPSAFIHEWAAYLDTIIIEEDLASVMAATRKGVQFEIIKTPLFLEGLDKEFNNIFKALHEVMGDVLAPASAGHSTGDLLVFLSGSSLFRLFASKPDVTALTKTPQSAAASTFYPDP